MPPQWIITPTFQKEKQHFSGGYIIKIRYISHIGPWEIKKKFRQVIFKQNLVIDGCGVSCEIIFRWMSMDLTDNKSALVQVMAWCRQATSHYLSQCWLWPVLSYGVTRSQWVNLFMCVVAEWIKVGFLNDSFKNDVCWDSTPNWHHHGRDISVWRLALHQTVYFFPVSCARRLDEDISKHRVLDMQDCWQLVTWTIIPPQKYLLLTLCVYDAVIGGHLFCGPYWGCAARKGPFFSPISVANGLFLTRFP